VPLCMRLCCSACSDVAAEYVYWLAALIPQGPSLLPPAWPCLPAEPGDDPASIRQRLQSKAEGSWTITFRCGSATKCGCPFELQLRHTRGSATVEVWEVERHQNHNPNSAEERAQLQMAPEVKGMVEMLLRCGVKPYNVWWQVTAGQLVAGSACTGSLGAASDARWSITLEQVYAVRKQLQRAEGYSLTSDATAVAAQMAELAKLGIVRFYQPLRERCDSASSDTVTIQCEDGLHQPLMIVLQTPFQQRMLAEFGRRLVFTDATGGTNKYGYPLQSMMVSMAGCHAGHHNLQSVHLALYYTAALPHSAAC
jgi:hypothetical protein